MKVVNLVVLSSCFILSMYADTTSNLICGKEIWEPGESTAPSTLDDDDDYDDGNYSQKTWPKPKAPDGNSPTLFGPKAGKDVFPPDE